MEGQPISERDLARLKERATQVAVTRARQLAVPWNRPTLDLQDTVRWTAVGIRDEWRRWQAMLPALFKGDFVFTVALWVAVFCVAAAVVAQPGIPITTRYGAGLTAVAYLYLYTQLARLQRPVPGRRVLLGLADGAVVSILGVLSMPYVPYAHGLVFFAAARVAARFRDPRIVPAGLLLLIPVEVTGHSAFFSVLLDSFGVLMTMLLVVQLTSSIETAQTAAQRQGALASVASSLARVRDEEALFAQLAGQALALAPRCAWAFWVKDPSSDEFRAVRWAGLQSGEMPGFSFSPALGPDRSAAVMIDGPLPGTATGACTLLQPATAEGELNGLVTVAGSPADFDPATRAAIREIAAEMAAALQRLQSLDAERQRVEAMEQANRLAGLATRFASDPAAALAAIRPALAEPLRSESLHLEWVEGDRLQLVVASDDPLDGHAPAWLALAGTRTAEALLEGRVLREPLTGRRPEDLFGVPAGLRQLAVAPLRSGQRQGTLQLGRRLPRAYSAGEALVLQLLAERLGLLFASAKPAGVANLAGEDA